MPRGIFYDPPVRRRCATRHGGLADWWTGGLADWRAGAVAAAGRAAGGEGELPRNMDSRKTHANRETIVALTVTFWTGFSPGASILPILEPYLRASVIGFETPLIAPLDLSTG